MTKQLKNETQKEMVERYKNGESATLIGKDMGYYTTTVSRILKRNGCKVGYKKRKGTPSLERR